MSGSSSRAPRVASAWPCERQVRQVHCGARRTSPRPGCAPICQSGNGEQHEGDAVEDGVRQRHADSARARPQPSADRDGQQRPWQADLVRTRCTDEPVQPEGEVGVVEPPTERRAGKDRGAWAEPPQRRTKAEKRTSARPSTAAERGADVPEVVSRRLAGVEREHRSGARTGRDAAASCATRARSSAPTGLRVHASGFATPLEIGRHPARPCLRQRFDDVDATICFHDRFVAI